MTKAIEIDYTNSDAICCVLVDDRSVELIFLVLKTFLEEKEELPPDYCDNPSDLDAPFRSEKEMLKFYSKAGTEAQTFFWNEKNERNDMVGVSFTSDSKIVFSITTSADGERELGILEKMKDLTGSKMGFINYNQYPEIKDSIEFEKYLKAAQMASSASSGNRQA